MNNRESCVKDGRNYKISDAAPTKQTVQRKPSIISRWRQRMKKNKISTGNSYLSLSEMVDRDYPFNTSNLDDTTDLNHSALSDWSLREALVQSANADLAISGINVTSDSQNGNKEIKPSSKLTDNGQLVSSPPAYRTRFSSKVILRKMKSFKLNLRPKSITMLAVL